MTDFSTYTELHPKNSYVELIPAGSRGYGSTGLHPGTNLPTDDSEPTVPEMYLFPTHLPGFDLRRKKWGENLPTPFIFPPC